MNGMPVIKVQLVHIQGPLKGQIQEYTETSITIGRHPSCTVQFPADTATISRKHAELVRVDNRYKVVDLSTNGTYLNGKRVTEAFLKDGDIIMLTEGGPKVSFLATITNEMMPINVSTPPAPEPIQAAAPLTPEPSEVSKAPVPQPEPAPRPEPQAPAYSPAPKPVQSIPVERPAEVPPQPVQPQQQTVQKVQAPLIVQFGPTLRSYKELPIVIGKKPDCDFVLMHPAMADQHAQIFFSQGGYWVRDLTGKDSITVNGSAIGFEARLKPQDVISLAPKGPAFNYISEGRFAEHEEEQEQETPAEVSASPAGEGKKSKSFLRDFFKK